MATFTPVRRTFSVEQSSAIASVALEEGNRVLISYQTNPDKTYEFDATDSFLDELQSVLSSDELDVSLGSLIAAGRKVNQLREVLL